MERGDGFTVWLTGLSAAGKTTIGSLVARSLEREGQLVEQLDGDVVREHLSAGLGFTRADRDTNIARIGWVASRLTRAGVAVVVSAISPFEEARGRARRLIEREGAFVEVFVKASLEECTRRDPKGLYARALRGDLPDFTGVDSPYEEPESPEVLVDTEHESPEQSADRVLDYLHRRKLV